MEGVCCKIGIHGSGLDCEDASRIPPELVDLGITELEWRNLMIDLSHAQKTYYWSPLKILSCLMLPCCFGNMSKYEVLQRNDKMNEWQNKINERIEQNGYFIKTKSFSEHVYQSKHNRKFVRYWIAIALTKQEVDILKGEPHCEGKIDNNVLLHGDKVDENTLCWHVP
jgi:hypothetical protein